MSFLSLEDLSKNLKNNSNFSSLIETSDNFSVYGLNQAMQVFLLAYFLQNTDKTHCIICPDSASLRKLREELKAYGVSLFCFYSREERTSLLNVKYSREFERERLYILSELARGKNLNLALEGRTLLQILPSLSSMHSLIMKLNIDEKMDIDELSQNLTDLGYEKKGIIEDEGDYARRGDIIDIYPVGLKYLLNEYELDFYESLSKEDIASLLSMPFALRLSFFDDEVDEVKLFSLESQRSFANLRSKKIVIYPAKEVLIRDDAKDRLFKSLERDLKSLKKEKNHEDLPLYKYIKQAQISLFNNLEFSFDPWLNSVFSEISKEGIFSYLNDSLLFFFDASSFKDALERSQKARVETLKENILQAKLPNCILNTYYDSSVIFQFFKSVRKIIALSSFVLPKDFYFSHPFKNISFISKEVSPLILNQGEEYLKQVIAESGIVKDKKTDMYQPKIVICTDDNSSSNLSLIEKLTQAWESQGYIRGKDFNFSNLPIKHGFFAPSFNLYVLGLSDVRGLKSVNKRSKIKNKNLLLFGDLQKGDYVVHDVHGIAIYEGVVKLSQDGQVRDYIKLVYAKDDCLFIPMEALSQVQKYRGVGTDQKPRLTRLGTNEWGKLKERARASTKALAINLISLYAKRFSQNGFSFSAYPHFEDNFAASFPYEETEDQVRCMNEIFADMSDSKCMDRLLCGDVGFGKTELAFRALFRAVCNNKQALLIAPTTVLVHQHFINLKDRLLNFPIRVEELSRFVTPAKQKEILLALKTGEIDILISTHRAFSNDVIFRDLGLLIIDEEQRFGVEHKEKIKEIKPLIDVLSLSATPIPRTLHMGLARIRDISLLQEPPQARREVMTYVLPFDFDIVEEAIDRELSRNGQIFYLFNNTYKISAKAKELQERMPNLKIGVAHGKMSEQHLEQVISDFLMRKYDLLLCTTLIESGIDMPNVNTIIVEGAERLGLSGLYQLRGRVGRGSRQAYAYFTYRSDENLTEKALKRLTAIRDFTELGSGFKIAMRDLEARGAGNILGAEQHGQLEAIGYDLYCRMLAEEIELAKLDLKENRVVETEDREVETSANLKVASKSKVEPPLQLSEVVFDLAIDAYLDKTYIADEAERMDLYRQLASIVSYEHYQDVYDSFLDRYGEPNLPLNNLLDLSYCRNLCAKLFINHVFFDKTGLHFSFSANRTFPAELVAQYMQDKNYGFYSIINASGGGKVEIIYRKELKSASAVFKTAFKIINLLESFSK